MLLIRDPDFVFVHEVSAEVCGYRYHKVPDKGQASSLHTRMAPSSQEE